MIPLLSSIFNRAIDTGSLAIEIESTQTYRGDPARVQQVFENLFQNTVTHATPTTESSIDLRTIETESQLPPTAPDKPQLDQPATTVRVGVSEQGFFVEDDGPGIDANLQENILEYGMSTGDGSGFGLAIVRTIVEAHGWEIAVTESTTGGARFEIQTSN